jgi:hypothetical protein
MNLTIAITAADLCRFGVGALIGIAAAVVFVAFFAGGAAFFQLGSHVFRTEFMRGMSASAPIFGLIGGGIAASRQPWWVTTAVLVAAVIVWSLANKMYERQQVS